MVTVIQVQELRHIATGNTSVGEFGPEMRPLWGASTGVLGKDDRDPSHAWSGASRRTRQRPGRRPRARLAPTE
jgi:hypothetical protein